MTKLEMAFKSLRKLGYIAKENYKCCSGCVGSALATGIGKRIKKKPELAEKIKGVVFYHEQDNDRKRVGKDFYLSYGPIEMAGHGIIGLPTEEVGREVSEALMVCGVEIEWDGSGDTRIKVKAKGWW